MSQAERLTLQRCTMRSILRRTQRPKLLQQQLPLNTTTTLLKTAAAGRRRFNDCRQISLLPSSSSSSSSSLHSYRSHRYRCYGNSLLFSEDSSSYLFHGAASSVRRSFSSSSSSSFSSLSSSSSNNNSNLDKNFLHSKYQQLVESGQLSQDTHQLHAIDALERLRNDIIQIAAASSSPSSSSSSSATLQNSSQSSSSASSSSSSWSWWNSSSTASSNTNTTMSSSSSYNIMSTSSSSLSPRGVYLHGGVGCGKSFLMHLFYDSLNSNNDNFVGAPRMMVNVTKQFVHYHKFMLDIHRELHVAKTQKHLQGEDAMAHVVRQIVQGSGSSGGHSRSNSTPTISVLCCDEFQVTDIADAMLVVRLLPLLWQSNCILVATSNRAPLDLYAQGLQRDLFVPLIHQLMNKCQVVSMEASETDYRVLIQQKQQLKSTTKTTTTSTTTSPSSSSLSMQDMLTQTYFVGKQSRKDFHELFYQVTQGASVAPMSLYVSNPVTTTTDVVTTDHAAAATTTTNTNHPPPLSRNTGARKVNIPWACPSRHICRFAFEDLCAKALGAADYMVLATHFSVIFIEQIPTLSVLELNWLRRFITFCDTMYDAHVVLVLQAAVPLDQLLQLTTTPTTTTTTTTTTTYNNNDDKDDNDTAKHNAHQLQQLRQAHDEIFAFDRTKSRLQEMTSATYIQETPSRWIPPPPSSSSSSTTTSTTKTTTTSTTRDFVSPRPTIAFRELRVEPSLADDTSR